MACVRRICIQTKIINFSLNYIKFATLNKIQSAICLFLVITSALVPLWLKLDIAKEIEEEHGL